ncbi:PMT-domain-containing protein [Metschnikowia bicuspidata var. bicuspidata NRRL YB-4993]|uniref:Dolichyl-phosphate-mannose--protein mannosyltransferase n=1 Tax=Metschnikowia bicuspidata var. bicuspidata NRRL YB-4993 TaxID=869754 RepID=A0A1A0HCS3_9ASCO|nr:PMT-domain-containing protein [Metschnikowia bicuspidata var. bicuspidata NRRL YB-4993]OBA21899.1 PMT-domain-containing protein [Metschnikowia bicuspidata var. bicuspidata NRRL YB-4993]
MAKKSTLKAPQPTPPQKPSLWDVDPVAEPRFEQGVARPYLVTEVPPSVTASRTVTAAEWPFLAVLFVAGIWVRLSNISVPRSVVFDEVHFGKFSKFYVLGNFFMDVHPPLAKMLFAAVLYLGGFKGDFDFTTIGDVYPENVPYVLMRLFAAVLGLLTVFLCYLTLRSLGVRPAVAFVTAACLLVENSFVTISKYILLDAPLVFFVASAVYAFKKFEVQRPFSWGWYRALLSCLVSLGLALLSKWVGLFTVAWVGVLCVIQMWFLIGDLLVKTSLIVRNAITRASFLLGVPLVLYLAFFSVHFSILSRDAEGSAFMSSAFRKGLSGSTVPESTTGPVGYGSVVTIRHINTKGGYLHSHEHYYPAGSKQQQITLYPHLDPNNDWLIEPYNMSIPDEFVPIKNGDKIRLQHVRTGLRLHSHDEKPPVSDRDWQKEASCYGYKGFAGDPNDDWIVEIVQHKSTENAKENLRAIDSVFRLKHAMSGHYLFSSDVKLPEEWGFRQQEVTSAGQGARPLTHWYIESNNNEKFVGRDRAFYAKLTFLQKFIEAHKVMWKVNNALTSYHDYQSSPYEWPLLLRGINYWARDHTQVYFIGNPVVWWTASACLFGFLVHVSITLLKWQSGSNLNFQKAAFNYNYQMFTYFVGWAIHYFPFFVMGRQLFLHHYLPAHYFAILGLGHFFDLLVTLSQRYRKYAYTFLVLFLTVTAVAYHTFSPLTSGTVWTKLKCLSSKLVGTWDYDCNTHFRSEKDYERFLLSSTSKDVTPTTSASVINEAKETPLVVDLEPKMQPPSNSVHEEPPAPETHLGEWPFKRSAAQEEAPQGELFDEATTGKDGDAAPQANIAETVDEPAALDNAESAAEQEPTEAESIAQQEEAEVESIAQQVPSEAAPIAEEGDAPIKPQSVAHEDPIARAEPEAESLPEHVQIEHETPIPDSQPEANPQGAKEQQEEQD